LPTHHQFRYCYQLIFMTFLLIAYWDPKRDSKHTAQVVSWRPNVAPNHLLDASVQELTLPVATVPTSFFPFST
jgi:hypothetical protein